MRNYLYFVKKRINGNKLITAFNIFISLAAFIVFIYSVSVLMLANRGKNGVVKAISGPINGFGLLSFDESVYANENRYDYYRLIQEAPEVKSIGSWSYGVLQGLKDTDISAVYMNYSAFEFNKIVLKKGEYLSEPKNGEIHLYLGADYSDIPIGTSFALQRNGLEIKYIVAGTMKKNTSIVDSQILLNGANGLAMNYTIDVDSMVIALMPDSDGIGSTNAVFAAADGYSLEQAQNSIREISNQLGIEVDFETLAHRLQTVSSTTDWLQKRIGDLTYVLTTAAFLIVICAQFITVTRRKEEIGVLVASGYGKKDISLILFLENLDKLLVGLLPAMLIVYVFWRLQDLGESTYSYLGWTLFGLPYIIGFFYAVILALLAALLPVFSIRGFSTNELVKGDWELSRKRIRLIKDNSLFFCLLMISFTVTSLVMFYALDYMTDVNAIIKENKKSSYGETYSIRSSLKEGVDLYELPEWSGQEGNIYFGITGEVGGNVADSHFFYILHTQKEELLETVHYKEYYSDGVDEATCIVAEAWINELQERNGREYLRINGVDCLVIGVFEPQSFDKLDERICLFKKGMPKDSFERIMKKGNFIYAVINRGEKKSDTLVSDFTTWAAAFLEQTDRIENFGMESSSNAFLFNDFTAIFKRLIYGMLVLCVMNSVFLAYIWGKTHTYDYALKRILGFGKIRLILETAGRFAAYEFISLLLSIALCGIYMAVQGKIVAFAAIITGNIALMVAFMLALALFISLFSAMSAMRTKAIYTVKNRE